MHGIYLQELGESYLSYIRQENTMNPTFICGHDSERFSQTAIPLWENPLTPNMTERARE